MVELAARGLRVFSPAGPRVRARAPPPAYFERLVGIAERIVGHATFPGKHTAVEQCLEEVGDLIAAGKITAGQGAILAGILLGARPRVA